MYGGTDYEFVVRFLIGLLFVLALTILGIFGIVWFNRWIDRRAEAKKDQAT